MDDVSPVVRVLWRLISVLEAEELELARKKKTAQAVQATSMEHLFHIINNRSTDENSYTRKVTDYQNDDNNFVDDRIFNNENLPAGAKVVNPKRTHSVKRNPAPMPPTARDNVPTSPKLVSANDIRPTDQKGWLIDQLRGKRVWCAVSNTLFCVFENENSQAHKQIIPLPGCQVRHLEFKSADQEGKVLNGVARHFHSKPASGVDRFQFILENPSSKQKYMFASASRSDLDQWKNALDIACSLNTCSHQPEEIDNNLHTSSSQQVELKGNIRRASFATKNNLNLPQNSSSDSCIQSQGIQLQSERHSSCLSVEQPSSINKSPADDVRRRIRKEQHDATSKPVPMKGTHDIKEICDTAASASRHDTNNRKSRSLFKMKSPLDVLFGRKKRSASADDAQGRRKRSQVPDMETASNSAVTLRLSSSRSSLPLPLDANKSLSSNAPPTGSAESEMNVSDKRRSLPVSSTDFQKAPKAFSLSLRRTASDLKDKFFRHVSNSYDVASKSAKIKRKDLNDISTSGFLQYRTAHKLSKMYCAISRGCFYAFRTDNLEEMSEMAVVLNQCTVAYVAQMEERTKSLFAFKVNQPNCRTIYLCAEDHQTLMKWMVAMQSEACKIQADDNLANELQEKRFSLKKKLARNKKTNETEFLQISPNGMQSKRNSCPHVEDLDGKSFFSGVSENIARREDTKKRSDSNDLNDNTVHRTISDQEINRNTDIGHTKYPSLQSNSSGTANWLKNLQTTQTISSKPNDLLVQSSTAEDHCGGCSNFISQMVADSDEVSAQPEQGDSTDVKPIHRRTQSTRSINTPPISSLKRTTSLEKVQFQESCTEDIQMTTANVSSSALELMNVPEIAMSVSTQDCLHIDTPSDTIIINQNYRIPILNTDDEVDELPPINCGQSDADIAYKPYRFNSSVHDDVLKEAWSTNEDFLLEVVKEKLRTRQKRDVAKPELGRENEDVCIVNDQWISTETQQIGMSLLLEGSMNTESSAGVFIASRMASSGQVSRLDKPGEHHACKNPSKVRHKGFMERRGFDEKWHRHWCVLCHDRLYHYLKPEDTKPVEVTELAGYNITRNTDQFQGKQFVLSLKHKSNNILLSCDSLEECIGWCESIKSTLDYLSKTNTKQETVMQVGMSQTKEEMTQAPSAETVKQKLLAEVLRQKQELEKVQAARAGVKGELNVVGKNKPASPILGTSPVTEDDKTCLLTRLMQRRMSTQIKLNAVQKQMESSSYSAREKKIMFQLVKKKPDLVQGHSDIDSQKLDLEQQARLLSSKLQELDTRLLSHGASPKIQPKSRIRSLRHSYDQALLKNLQLAAEANRDTWDEPDGNGLPKLKDKEKAKDVNRSVSIKNSVQKFAYKTFAKANWYWNKKSLNQTDEKGSTSLNLCTNSLSDLTPDVIDMTNSSQSNVTFLEQDRPDIPEPPDNFRSEYAFMTRTMPGRHQTSSNQTLQKTTMSRLSLSPSSRCMNTFGGQIRISASSPSLNKLQSKQDDEISQILSNSAVISGEAKENVKEDSTTSVSLRCHGSSGVVRSRRQVSATVLAEIEAFEELSMKFLGTDPSLK